MVRFKGCTRCSGDITIEEFHGETEFVCLQCGHREYAAHHPEMPRRSQRVHRGVHIRRTTTR